MAQVGIGNVANGEGGGSRDAEQSGFTPNDVTPGAQGAFCQAFLHQYLKKPVRGRPGQIALSGNVGQARPLILRSRKRSQDRDGAAKALCATGGWVLH